MQDSLMKGPNPERFLRRSFVLACLASLLLCSQGKAGSVLILAYGQQTGASTMTLTNTAGSETLSSVNVPILVGTFDGTSVAIPAVLNFSTTSVPGTFTNVGGNLSEAFTGSFSIISSGLNLLSGTFTDTLTGTVGGVTLSLRADSTLPGESISYTSDFALPLGPPQGMSLSFTNVTPVVSFANDSIGVSGATTMSQSGVFSASAVPEPSSFTLALMGIGLSGLFTLRRFFKRSSVA